MRKESDTVRRLLAEDGLNRWQPDPALLPPQAPAGASMDELLQGVPTGGIAWLAFGNSGVTEMLMNWVHWVLALGKGRSMVVACYDEPLFVRLRAMRVPAYNYTGALPRIHFRGTPFLSHRMGFLKALTIKEVLLTCRHVLVPDSDVVWLRDPTAELDALAAADSAHPSTASPTPSARLATPLSRRPARHPPLPPGASLAPSTDCIHVEADQDKTPRRASPYLCGHAPGNTQGAVFNTGVIFLASTNATVAFCEK